MKDFKFNLGQVVYHASSKVFKKDSYKMPAPLLITGRGVIEYSDGNQEEIYSISMQNDSNELRTFHGAFINAYELISLEELSQHQTA